MEDKTNKPDRVVPELDPRWQGASANASVGRALDWLRSNLRTRPERTPAPTKDLERVGSLRDELELKLRDLDNNRFERDVEPPVTMALSEREAESAHRAGVEAEVAPAGAPAVVSARDGFVAMEIVERDGTVVVETAWHTRTGSVDGAAIPAGHGDAGAMEGIRAIIAGKRVVCMDRRACFLALSRLADAAGLSDVHRWAEGWRSVPEVFGSLFPEVPEERKAAVSQAALCSRHAIPAGQIARAWPETARAVTTIKLHRAVIEEIRRAGEGGLTAPFPADG